MFPKNNNTFHRPPPAFHPNDSPTDHRYGPPQDRLAYTVNIEAAEEGGFVATVPALPGCATQGETYQKTLTMVQDCIELYLESLIADGEPIPIEPEPQVTHPIVSILVKPPSPA